jgi:ribosome-interacting GTPase 1
VPGMCSYEDVQIQLVDTPPMTAEHVPPGLFGTIRQADVIGIVVDASADPLEGAEAALTILSQRNIQPVTAARNELDAEDPTRYPGLVIANKMDLGGRETIDALRELYAGRLEVIPVSAATGQGLDRLAERLWQLLAVIRVYTKEPGRPADNDRPYTLPIGSTIEDLAAEIHRDLPEMMKFARIWGQGRFDGQRAHRTETLRDKDVVEIHQ